MTGSESSTVQITIMVRDEGSAATIQNIETRMGALGASGTTAGKSLAGMGGALKDIGTAGVTASSALSGFSGDAVQGVAALNAGLEGAKGNIREVGGLGREMGLNLSYSMKHAIADNEALMAGLRSLTGLFVAIGVISIGEQLIEGAVHLYEKWLDVDKAVDDYNQKAQEAAQVKLFDTASLETVEALLTKINDQMKELQTRKDAIDEVKGKSGIPFAGLLGAIGGGFGGEFATGEIEPGATYTTKDSRDQAKKMAQAAALSQQKTTLTNQETQQQLENQKRHDEAVLTGITKAAQVQRDEDEITWQKYKALRDNMAATAKTAAPLLGMSEADTQNLLKNQYNSQEQAEYNRNYQQGADQRVVIGRQEAEKEQRQREQVTQKLNVTS